MDINNYSNNYTAAIDHSKIILFPSRLPIKCSRPNHSNSTIMLLPNNGDSVPFNKCLTDFIYYNCPEDPNFKKLMDLRDSSLLLYEFQRMGHITFINTSQDGIKSGFLEVPNDITGEQLKRLEVFEKMLTNSGYNNITLLCNWSKDSNYLVHFDQLKCNTLDIDKNINSDRNER